jgi:hypothetical protein
VEVMNFEDIQDIEGGGDDDYEDDDDVSEFIYY